MTWLSILMALLIIPVYHFKRAFLLSKGSSTGGGKNKPVFEPKLSEPGRSPSLPNRSSLIQARAFSLDWSFRRFQQDALYYLSLGGYDHHRALTFGGLDRQKLGVWSLVEPTWLQELQPCGRSERTEEWVGKCTGWKGENKLSGCSCSTAVRVTVY